MPGLMDKETTLRLRQKVKQNKLITLHRHLSVTSNLDLINLDQFRLETDSKEGAKVFEFYNGDKWVSLTRRCNEKFTRHR